MKKDTRDACEQSPARSSAITLTLEIHPATYVWKGKMSASILLLSVFLFLTLFWVFAQNPKIFEAVINLAEILKIFSCAIQSF